MSLEMQQKLLNTNFLFSNLKTEQMTLRRYRVKENLYNHHVSDMWGSPKSKEFRAILSWRLNTYSKTAKVKKSSILYKIFKRQEFSDRELALAETFAQWIGTYVGQSFIQYKLKMKGYEEYGECHIPNMEYLLPEGYRTGKDYDFMEAIAEHFNSNCPKVKKFLKDNWMGLY